MTDNSTEREVIQRAREGDSEAFRVLYDRHVDRVFRLSYRMCGDEEMAQDLTQDAFVRAYQRLEQFRGDSAFSTWLHSVTVSVVLNGMRRRKRKREVETDLNEAIGRAEMGCEEVDGDRDVLLRDRIKVAVNTLPELYRMVFVMHDVEGFNHGEIASSLGIAEGTSKARLSRARKRLRTKLTGVICDGLRSDGSETQGLEANDLVAES